MFGSSFQLPTTAERAVIKSLSTVSDNETPATKQLAYSKAGRSRECLIGGSEKRICRWALKFRVRILLKGAVNNIFQLLFAQRGSCVGDHVPSLLHISSALPLRRYLSLQVYLTIEPMVNSSSAGVKSPCLMSPGLLHNGRFAPVVRKTKTNSNFRYLLHVSAV